MRELVPDMMLLFSGYQDSYGQYSAELTDEGGKLKGKVKSVKGKVTIELWLKHLIGTQGLGIIPINEHSKVKFAAIDIDDYHLDLKGLTARIKELRLPLVLCRTKSGGAHLYLFLEEWSDATDVQALMREFAHLLGHGNAEVFPKQTRIISERGDIGSWINMPYMNFANTTRYAIDDYGNKLTFEEFLRHAQSKIANIKELSKTKFKVREDDALAGGPPCLNHLCAIGFPQGTRNNGLFNLAIYAQKAHGDDWKAHVLDYNQKYMNPPMEIAEVNGVIKSLSKKSFTYTCKQPPLTQYCHMSKCRGCKHGIGTGDLGMPKLGSLTKIKTVPPIWFLEIEGGSRLELTTEQLQSQKAFQYKCMEKLNIMPVMPKMEVWNEMIGSLLSTVVEVEVPKDTSPAGQLLVHLEEFCTSRVQGKVPEDLLLGKPYTSGDHIYIRFKDFLAYLQRQRFNLLKHNEIVSTIQDLDPIRKFFNLKGKGTNTLGIPVKLFSKQIDPFDVPETKTPDAY